MPKTTDQMFMLHIETGSAAFGVTTYERAEELARILETIAAKLRQGRDSGPVHDVNGNRVGEFEIAAGHE